MTIKLVDLPFAHFKTTRAADEICNLMIKKLGFRHRYEPARLAIARSLSLPTVPPSLTDKEKSEMATALKGA